MTALNEKNEYSYMKGIIFFLLLVWVGIFSTGCIGNIGAKNDNDNGPTPSQAPISNEVPVSNVTTTSDRKAPVEQPSNETKMVTYDVSSLGRNDPFAPKAEVEAYARARQEAIAEARRTNAEIARLKKLKNQSIREADDISPYNFNLPTPPTSLASQDAAASRITRTKVVGIMYNKNNPSAILNIEDKDYLVRQGDLILGEKFKVQQINPNWITVGLGSNIYSASIGELFSADEITKSTNDLYNLENRFGGRKG